MDGNFTGNPTLLTITCLQMSTVVISSYLYVKNVRLQNRYDDPTYSRWLNQQELLEYAKNTQGLVQLRASYVAWNRRREAKAGEYIYVYNYIHNMYIIYITHIDIYIYIHTYIYNM